MEKTLLQVNNATSSNETTATVTSVDEKRALGELMEEMQAHLAAAQTDLLQPRPQVVEQLLRKVLH